jgi:uncharacterized protein YjiS (DUF1127 family)
MSILTSRSIDTTAAGSGAGLLRWVAAWSLRLMTTLMASWHRRATIKALRELDDHTLRDIGVTRSDIEGVLRDKSSLDVWLQL